MAPPRPLKIVAFLGKDPIYSNTVQQVVSQEPDLAGVRLVASTSKKHLLEIIPDAEVFLTFHIPDGAIDAAVKLRWLAFGQVGVERGLTPQVKKTVKERGIIVTNAGEVTTPMVAEHALALMLALIRRLKTCLEYQRRKVWGFGDLRDRVDILAGKTVAILGLGRIGYQVAHLCRTFGMRVVALDREPRDSDVVDKIYRPNQLHQLLGKADFVVLCLPLTDATRNIMSREAFSAMKEGSYLVNVARGGLVDEGALLEALDSGWLAGAALDVVAEEPLLAESPLWEQEGVIITHHLAGLGPKYFDRLGELMVENIRRYLAGEELVNVVDVERGY